MESLEGRETKLKKRESGNKGEPRRTPRQEIQDTRFLEQD